MEPRDVVPPCVPPSAASRGAAVSDPGQDGGGEVVVVGASGVVSSCVPPSAALRCAAVSDPGQDGGGEVIQVV